jgi:hypothetical protein
MKTHRGWKWLNPRESTSSAYWIACLDVVTKREISASVGKPNPVI